LRREAALATGRGDLEGRERSTPDTPVELLGRSDEQARLSEQLERARVKESSSLVLHGEAGIGKTALLDDLVARAHDFEIARVAGIEVERQLGFAGLHRLLAPYLARRSALPGPQQSALSAVFGLDNGAPPNLFLVGLATLTLLSEAANDRPLVCVIDDAQWLDGESLAVLAFVARRVQADAIAMIFAVRDPELSPNPLEGLDHLQLGPLSVTDATALIHSSVESTLDRTVATRILDDARGNPLALVELSRRLSDAQLAGGAILPEHLPLSERLERRFLAQSRRMSDDAQLLLLVAAADGSADAVLIERALAVLGVDLETALTTEVSELLGIQPAVCFRHPLMRSAVYRGASDARRQAVHRALASVLDPLRDGDRRAWHLAATVVLPDEEIAAELDDSADRARSRGGYSAEAAFRVRAAELSINDDRRWQRTLAAGRAALNAGAVATAEQSLDRIPDSTDDAVVDAETLRLRGAVHVHQDAHAEAATDFVEAARRLDPNERALAREALLDATNSYLVTRVLAMAESGLGHQIAQLVLETRDDASSLVRDLVLDGWAFHTLGDSGRSGAAMREAGRLLRRVPLDADLIIRLSALGFFTAFQVWDDGALAQWPLRVSQTTREVGALVALRVAIMTLATVDVLFGHFRDAELHHAEHAELTRALGGNPELYRFQELELAAWRGQDAEIRSACEALVRAHDEQSGYGSLVHNAANALIVLDVAAGRYTDAVPHVVRTFVSDPPQFGVHVLPNMVEVGIRTGDRNIAQDALVRLTTRAESSGTPWAMGLVARCRALATSGANAEQHYLDAISLLGDTLVATDLARAELLYGEWLRRQRRPTDARVHLRLAYDMFDEMGARGFADRAARELAATGEQVRRDPIDSRRELTPQEMQVAQMAAARMTNREIAAQLFISANTVEYHLRKVFRKLGVTSRRELERALHS